MMLRTLILAAAAITLTQPASAQLSMGPDGIGPIKRGWTISDILVSGMPYARELVPTEGDPVTVYTLKVDGEVSITSEYWVDDTPFRLGTTSSLFVTKEGARVGDTMATLRRLYPRGRVSKGLIDGAWLSFLPFGNDVPRSTPVLVFSFDPGSLSDDCMSLNTGCPDMSAMKSTGFAVTWLN